MSGKRSENWADKERIDFNRCYLEAEGMYFKGDGLKEIGVRLGLTEKRLEGWEKEYGWVAKLEALMEAPRGIGEMLRENLRRQVAGQVGQKNLKVEEVKAIAELTNLIAKIEGAGGNLLAATIMVIRDLSGYIRANCSDRDEYHLVSNWLQGYLRSKTDV